MDLNIRKVDRESVKRLKQDALACGVSMRELAIQRMGILSEKSKEVSVEQDERTENVPDLQLASKRTTRQGKREPSKESLQAVPRESSYVGSEVNSESKSDRSGKSVAPFRGSGKCPHGYMSWMTCRNANGGCQ